MGAGVKWGCRLMANLTLVFSCNNRYTLSCKITVQKPTNTNTDNPSGIAATPSPQPSASASATASAATDSPIPTATTSVTTNSPNPTATTSVATNVPVPVSTPVQTPSASAVPATSNLTLSSETALSSASVDGKPTYNADGSVTFTVTQQYGGGGLVFALDTSKTAQDLSDYSKVSFRVSADAEAPVVFRAFTSDVFWNGFTEIGSTTTSKDKKEIICDIPYGDKLCGFGVKYNTWGYDTSTIPQKLTITIHAISLVRDSRDITDATTNYFDETASKKNYKDETSMPGINFTKADLIMDYAKENDIKVRGHVLVWDADMCDWFFRIGYDTSKGYASADIIKTRLKDYIRQVITHFEEKYPGIIYCWDVVNEAVGDSAGEYKSSDARHVRTLRGGKKNMFYDTIGEDYVELSFQYAHDIIEDLKSTKPNLNIKLYYNDYSTFYETKREAICELVKSINSYQSDGKGGYVKLCDGVGMQSYIGGFGTQSGCMNENDINLIRTAIQRFSSLGVEVQATELAVRNYVDDEAVFAKHADFYKKLFEAYIDVNSGTEKPLTAVTIWGIMDDPAMDSSSYGYRMNGPFCGLFNENFGVKPAFVSIHDLMKKTH